MVSAIALSTVPSLAVHSTTPAILAQTGLPTQLDQTAQTGYTQRTDPVINDFAQVLTPTEADKIRRVLGELKATHDIEVVVVTIEAVQKYETSDPSFERFATNLFNTWGIGDADRDDGVLMLLAIRDRAVRIELGAGYSSRYDAVMQRIIDQSMLPQFKNGQYGEGLYQGSRALVTQLTAESSPAQPSPLATAISNRAKSLWSDFLVVRQQAIDYAHQNEEATQITVDVLKELWFLAFITVGSAVALQFAISLKKIIVIIIKGIIWVANEIIKISGLNDFYNAYAPYLSRYRPHPCPTCQTAMTRQSSDYTHHCLDSGQKLEQQLQSAVYDGWKCTSCGHLQLIRYPKLFSAFKRCPSCHYRTLKIDRRVTERATYYASGSELMTQHCRHCNYDHQETITLPKLVRSHASSSSSSSHRSSGGGSSGGGSSRGGGASGRW